MVNSDNERIVPEIVASVALAHGWSNYEWPAKERDTDSGVTIADLLGGQFDQIPQWTCLS